jgi:small subunit ribosomal protein S13
MARLAGVDLPRDKRMEIALTYIYGVGRTRSHEILSATGVSPELRTKDLTDEDLVRLRDYIEENYKVEGDLRREVQADIRRKIEIGCYEGLRAAGAWSANQDQRPHPQGSEEDGRRQEEGRKEVAPATPTADQPPRPL